MHVGFVMNPVAGMGGRVGLKGTDGKVEEAIARGAEPRAPDRARRALERLAAIAPETVVSTAADPMGERLVREAGFEPARVVDPFEASDTRPADPLDPTATTAEHTTRVVEAFAGIAGSAGSADAAGTADGSDDAASDDRDPVDSDPADPGPADSDPVDLVLFVGGDGTATDVATALEGTEVPMLGVPAGVKVYSSVFGVSPEDAAAVAATFSRTERREVMDIDEDAYREGAVHPQLRAVARVPVAEELQSSKQTASGTVESLAEGVAEDIRERQGVTYVLAPGSTVGAIKAELGFEPSPIGVDVWRDGEVVVRDGAESEILDALGEENVIVVSPIGGQGFVFGRGNPQLSPAVIRRCELRIVASRTKLDEVRALRVDTDDPELDAELAGWVRVRVGKFETRMMKVV